MKRLPFRLLCAFFLFFSSVSAQTPSWVSMATAQAKLDSALTFCIYITDINNDNYPDMMTIYNAWTKTAVDGIRTYINVKDISSSDPNARMFVDVTATSGANAMPNPSETSTGTLVVALADINNDGNVDMVRGNYYHDAPSGTDDRCEVLLGDGKGHFTLVNNNGLHDLGLINPSSLAFLDYNKDGNVDLFIGVWFQDYAANIWRSGYLMKGNGDGTFTNVSAAAGITQKEPMYGCTAVDWNNDGWYDIATGPYCRDGGQLWKNKGDGTFENVAASAGYNCQVKGGDNGQPLCMWGSMPSDFDNDGDMDFFFSLVHGGLDANEGHSTIVTNAGAANNYKLAWDINRITRDAPKSSHNGDYDASWFDIDNDGWEDLVMAQGHYVPATDRLYIFHQNADNTFSDITQEIGMVRTEAKNIHLLEVMDYDLDGDDDIIFCNDDTRRLNLVKNDIGHTKNWTGVKLIAPPGVNKSCIGSRIVVWSGGVRHMRDVYAGRGNAAGQQPFAMIFGLGDNTVIDSIQVIWPITKNTATTVYKPHINQYITISADGLAVAEVANNQSADLKVYPNPAKDFVLIQLTDNTASATIDIYNMEGRKVSDRVVYDKTSITKYCSVKNLAPGQYIIKATTAEGKVLSQPFMKID